jgi:hypothetical protein
MTKLVNLESYLECSQYAHLFAEDPAKLIPNSKGLPLAYRDFCRRYQSQSFLSIPTMASAQTQTLTPRKSQLPQQNIGLTLPDNSSEQIFIVREANSLVLRSLQSRYIYANVYRYWSYVEQLKQFTNSDKPLVIYDLDSFTPAQITPLTFENHGNAPYPIPIIDTRSLKQYDALKLSQPYEKIYNSICLAIANKIVQDLNLDTNNLLEIANYIKKINLFQNIEFTSSEHISLILEINHRFYSYNLYQKNLKDIVYRHLPISDLSRVIGENPNYNFVLLSSYAKLPSIKEALEWQFQGALLILDLNKNNFSDIWKEKIRSNFALFGQHLDRISFFVKRAGEDTEICLSSRTCYEGEQEAIVDGQYEKNGKLEQNFSLKTKDVTLPFWINDEPFLDSETGVEQIYKIENQYFDQTPNLDIKIRFRLKPGLMPKLEILDNYGRIIDSKLIDREEPVIEVSDTLGFIPKQDIFAFRQNKSQKFINILKTQAIQIPRTLSDFTRTINRSITDTTSQDNIDSLSLVTRSFLNLIQNYSNIENRSKNGLEVYVIDNQDKDKNLEDFTQNYENIDKRVKEFLKNIKLNGITQQSSMAKDYRSIYRNIFQILGKSFAFSESLDIDFLYDAAQIYYGDRDSLTRDNSFIYSIHLHNIARMSCTNERRKAFWDLFNVKSKYHQKEFYKVDDYIWGYARILLWYANFEGGHLSLEIFSQHFTKILSHCLTLNVSADRKYLTDALISLIYLLTFREIDAKFVEKGSQLYSQSKKLCEKLVQNPIRSRKANIDDMSLNQFFEQLLDGSATQEQVSNMIEID